MIDRSAGTGAAAPYGVVGCRRGPSSIASEVTFTKAASDSNVHNVGRAHSSPYLGSGVLERFRGVARFRIRTGPRRKSSEQRRRLSSSGCRRQLEKLKKNGKNTSRIRAPSFLYEAPIEDESHHTPDDNAQ